MGPRLRELVGRYSWGGVLVLRGMWMSEGNGGLVFRAFVIGGRWVDMVDGRDNSSFCMNGKMEESVTSNRHVKGRWVQ